MEATAAEKEKFPSPSVRTRKRGKDHIAARMAAWLLMTLLLLLLLLEEDAAAGTEESASGAGADMACVRVREERGAAWHK
jgi:hypothetical protein